MWMASFNLSCKLVLAYSEILKQLEEVEEHKYDIFQSFASA